MHTLRHRRKEVVVVILILVVALFFRVSRLDQTPPGLWVDEAVNGTDALTVIDTGTPRIFYPDNNGREGLFISIQALSVKAFGNTAWSLRFVSAIIGTLTVLGLYLLVKKLFSWQHAAVAASFLAVSLWHVNFSRISFRAIMVPFILVWAFYFLWRGFKKGQTGDFIVGGAIAGLGLYTYPAYRVSPLIFGVFILNYWLYIKEHFELSSYTYARTRLFKQIGLMVLTTCIVAIPFAIDFAQKMSEFTTREGQLSVFAQPQPLIALIESKIKTLGMFNFMGDFNPRHNISGEPALAWPIGIFFVIGFLHELRHWLSRKHGHFSPTHTFLFAWFFVMLLPGFLSVEAPHALRTIGVIPVVMIFASLGFLWTLEYIRRWYGMAEPTYQINAAAYRHEAKRLTAVVAVIFLCAVGIFEHYRYFTVWANHPYTSVAFTKHLSDIASYLNQKTDNTPVYIIVNEPGVMVNGVSVFAQPIRYLTRTHTADTAAARHITYLRPEELAHTRLPARYIVIPTKDTLDIAQWAAGKRLTAQPHTSFVTYHK